MPIVHAGSSCIAQTPIMRRRTLPSMVMLCLGLAGTSAASTINLVGRNDPNLTAQVSNYGLSGQDFTFTLTSVNGALAFGSITSIGFNFSDGGAIDQAMLVSSTNSNYTLVDGPISANATGLAATLDFALLTGSTFNGGGNPNDGITPAHSATFDVRANFGGLTAGQIAESIVARFQNGSPIQSDVATYQGITVTGNVPEPVTSTMLGFGLFVFGVAWHKSRRGSRAGSRRRTR